MKKEITVAFAGNPNAGKTTIFNELTGLHQHVGNYPGVTVEKKEGNFKYKDTIIKIVDLPGTYSLTAYSIEEIVTRNFIVDENPDVVVDVLDSSNIERNLYLTTQLIELGAPLILCLNMSDVAQSRGIEFNLKKLSGFLGAPVIPTVGHKNKGVEELLDTIIKVANKEVVTKKVNINYGKDIENEIKKISNVLPQNSKNDFYKLDNKWISIKLLENDSDVMKRIKSKEVFAIIEQSKKKLERLNKSTTEILLAEKRYGFISGVCSEAVKSTVESRHNISDAIDSIVISRVLGLPIFLGLMYLIFQFTFSVGQAPMGWIENGFQLLGNFITGLWPAGSNSPLRSLLVDGIIGGVGGVIMFLPNIMLLFFAIAILEGTGYMARVAFIMDSIMHKIGLHGKSFIPMIIGFGCSVPAIMATRTLENRRDRLATMLVIPLMSCGARLPIYTLIIPAFFAERWRAPMLWIIYMIGVLLAILVAKFLRATIFKGESIPLVMELPIYRMPTIKSILIDMWENSWLYLKKAGTVILGISILLWAMTSYPQKKIYERDYKQEIIFAQKDSKKIIEIKSARQTEKMSYSVAGRIGKLMEPLLKPMGFDWKIGTALIGAFAAKEVFVAQLGIVYSVSDADEKSETLRMALKRNYNPLTAFCIMLFLLISVPCIATFAVTKQESGSWKWAFLQLGGLTALAYIITVVVYQVGTILKIGV